MGLKDGLASLELNSTTFSGTNAQFSAGQIDTSEIGSGAILEVNISGAQVGAAKQSFIGTGSPTGYGLSVQCGSSTFTNTAVTVTFGTAFAAAPIATITLLASGANHGYVTGTAAGSFVALGESGINFSWIAVGSGDI